ncbi:MAG: pilus assembly protein TadG-related protein [Terriglobales bacterium]
MRTGNREDEQGVIITLVAVFMLFVVGAMAALSIDVVTIYTARSEAQLAADSAALAGARVLANSGATSDGTGALLASVESSSGLAPAVAYQVAEQNQVGGTNLTSGQITITFGGTVTNPTVNVKVQSNLPTFFARIWGSTQVTVAASATAEVYNPSATGPVSTGATRPLVAPLCVKPWLLPNIPPEPAPANPQIFDPVTGAIFDTNLLGWTSTNAPATRMSVVCPGGDCSGAPLPIPVAWQYYPGDPTSFPAPTNALASCSLIPVPTPYQESIAGCIQTPIACNSQVAIDTSAYTTRNSETSEAVNCLTHATTNKGDTAASTGNPPTAPFQFVAGDDNPISALAGSTVMVSDSLVTVPVFKSTSITAPTNPVTIIGFAQLFLNPEGLRTPNGGLHVGQVKTTVINLAGCGSVASGTPIVGNGASPVVVRLISGS